MSKLYIAGPMRGIPYYNFPHFYEVEERLIRAGYDVVNPARLDEDEGHDIMGLPEDTDWRKVPDGFDLMECIERDFAALKEVGYEIINLGGDSPHSINEVVSMIQN